jgi:hypothetical protein
MQVRVEENRMRTENPEIEIQTHYSSCPANVAVLHNLVKWLNQAPDSTDILK